MPNDFNFEFWIFAQHLNEFVQFHVRARQQFRTVAFKKNILQLHDFSRFQRQAREVIIFHGNGHQRLGFFHRNVVNVVVAKIKRSDGRHGSRLFIREKIANHHPIGFGLRHEFCAKFSPTAAFRHQNRFTFHLGRQIQSRFGLDVDFFIGKMRTYIIDPHRAV